MTPSFNQGRFLEETIRSVLRQNYPHLEYIIIDGGSTDNSLEIIKQYDSKLTCWTSEPDLGQSDAINKGLAMATGSILGWINSDDLLLPNALTTVVSKLIDLEGASWLIGGSRLVNGRGFSLGSRFPSRELSRLWDWSSNWFPQQSTFWTRQMWHFAGPLDVKLQYAMDYDLWLRMYRVSRPILTDALLSCYRLHQTAKCVVAEEDTLAEVYKVCVRHQSHLWRQEISKHELLHHYARVMINRAKVAARNKKCRAAVRMFGHALCLNPRGTFHYLMRAVFVRIKQYLHRA